jgi:hypothetical protein
MFSWYLRTGSLYRVEVWIQRPDSNYQQLEIIYHALHSFCTMSSVTLHTKLFQKQSVTLGLKMDDSQL